MSDWQWQMLVNVSCKSLLHTLQLCMLSFSFWSMMLTETFSTCSTSIFPLTIQACSDSLARSNEQNIHLKGLTEILTVSRSGSGRRLWSMMRCAEKSWMIVPTSSPWTMWPGWSWLKLWEVSTWRNEDSGQSQPRHLRSMMTLSTIKVAQWGALQLTIVNVRVPVAAALRTSPRCVNQWSLERSSLRGRRLMNGFPIGGEKCEKRKNLIRRSCNDWCLVNHTDHAECTGVRRIYEHILYNISLYHMYIVYYI